MACPACNAEPIWARVCWCVGNAANVLDLGKACHQGTFPIADEVNGLGLDNAGLHQRRHLCQNNPACCDHQRNANHRRHIFCNELPYSTNTSCSCVQMPVATLQVHCACLLSLVGTPPARLDISSGQSHFIWAEMWVDNIPNRPSAQIKEGGPHVGHDYCARAMKVPTSHVGVCVCVIFVCGVHNQHLTNKDRLSFFSNPGNSCSSVAGVTG